MGNDRFQIVIIQYTYKHDHYYYYFHIFFTGYFPLVVFLMGLKNKNVISCHELTLHLHTHTHTYHTAYTFLYIIYYSQFINIYMYNTCMIIIRYKRGREPCVRSTGLQPRLSWTFILRGVLYLPSAVKSPHTGLRIKMEFLSLQAYLVAQYGRTYTHQPFTVF